MNRERKVGVFVIAGLAITILAVFLIGDQRRLWVSKVTYETSFENVAGLREGSPVRLGGVDVGDVTRVGHSADPRDPRIHVQMAIVKKDAERIREDTVATVTNKGLLGDKMVELLPGTGPRLDPSKPIKSREPPDLFSSINQISGDARDTLTSIRDTAKTFSDPEMAKDIKTSAHDLRVILDAVAQTESPAHKLLFDPEAGQKLDRTLGHLEAASANLAAVTGDARDVTARVRQGPGLAHALVYDGDLSSHAAGSLAELHGDLEQIRKGNGLVHALVYGDGETQHLMGNVNAMSDDLRAIVANLKAGKGTLGALLVDPSIYEDVKSIVGNVDRNNVLRALVRYSIKEDEKK